MAKKSTKPTVAARSSKRKRVVVNYHESDSEADQAQVCFPTSDIC
jgi:hypothetical protein